MAETTAPAGTIHYAEDITRADIDAVAAFLTEILDSQLLKGPAGTVEYRTARALKNVVIDAAASGRWYLDKLADKDEDARVSRLIGLKNDWQRLVDTAQLWSELPGHNMARWRRVALR